MDAANQAPKATNREWLGLAVIALPCLLYSMDLTVLNLAVPVITAHLKPSSVQLLWIIDVYGFVLAGSLIPMGTLGDRFGRRRVLLAGAAAFGLISVLAAFSSSAEMLIASRALLGLAGATLAPSTLSLIRNMFRDASQRRVALAVWISSYSMGGAIGPLIGGALLEHFWWGSVFLVSVPVMVLLLAVGPLLLPEFRDPQAGRLDVVSAVLSFASVLPVIYGLKRFAADGLTWPAVLSIAAGLGAGFVFLTRQRSLSDPMIDLRLFRAPAFNASLLTYALATFIAFGVFVFVGQHLQLVLGLSPLEAGLWTVPFAGGFIVGSQVTPALARRVHPAILMAMGLVLAAGGFAALVRADAASGPGVLVVGMVVFSLGLAPVFTLANDLIIGSAPPERAGAAAALSETSSELGGALGIAVLGSIGTAVYQNAMAHHAPAGIPADSLDRARDTLGAALAVANRLPDPIGPELARVAREAFASSLQVASALAAVIAILLALAAGLLLKPRRTRPVERNLLRRRPGGAFHSYSQARSDRVSHGPMVVRLGSQEGA
jgi:DHA2 family multidrug resistance protein-like MFS transporter